jgi:hypothetical protein
LWIAAIAAGLYLYTTGGSSLFLIGVSWGVGSAVGMLVGTRGASQKAWDRKLAKWSEALVKSTLFALIFFPAIVALLTRNLLAALCLAVVIVAGMALTISIDKTFFGPISRPAPPIGSDATRP